MQAAGRCGTCSRMRPRVDLFLAGHVIRGGHAAEEGNRQAAVPCCLRHGCRQREHTPLLRGTRTAPQGPPHQRCAQRARRRAGSARYLRRHRHYHNDGFASNKAVCWTPCADAHFQGALQRHTAVSEVHSRLPPRAHGVAAAAKEGGLACAGLPRVVVTGALPRAEGITAWLIRLCCACTVAAEGAARSLIAQ